MSGAQEAQPKRMRKQSDRPQNVTSDVWYYEEGRKLGFVVHTKSGESIQFYVPLRMLERTIARSPKKGRRR